MHITAESLKAHLDAQGKSPLDGVTFNDLLHILGCEECARPAVVQAEPPATPASAPAINLTPRPRAAKKTATSSKKRR